MACVSDRRDEPARAEAGDRPRPLRGSSWQWLAPVGLAVLALLAWNLAQQHALGRARQDLNELHADLEATRELAVGSAAKIGGHARRIEAVEDRMHRSTTGPRQSEMVQLRRWIGRADDRSRLNADRLGTLARQLDRLERVDGTAPRPEPSGDEPALSNDQSVPAR
jgi:hypothetical protein